MREARGPVVAIIPARGGSKGIPRKNVRIVAGRPLVVHSIQHAIDATLIDRVVVSTDDPEIARVSRQSGAEVVLRPVEISGDGDSSESALRHALGVLREQDGLIPDLVVFLQATSPIRTPADVDGAVRTLREGGFDSVFTSSPAHGFVWEQMETALTPLTYDPRRRPMRQEIGERIAENGSIYVFRPHVLLDGGSRLGGRIGHHRMGYLEGIQIDDPRDLALAEWVLGVRARSEFAPRDS